MHSDVAISVKNLTKTYRIFGHPGDRIKQALTLGQKQYYKEFTALKDVSFEIKKGETVGIIGRNGSGKSTLLQLICGILKPTSGSVEVNGRISALLELGAGFNPEFTGRENVFFQGAVMGITRKEMAKRFDDIAAFAEIGDFIDQPVRVYSSGMFLRLAFATAVNVDPEILLVDEALAVGDAGFRSRCFRRIGELRVSGCSILFVSHDRDQVAKFCGQAVLLDDGELLSFGPTDIVLAYGQELMRAEPDLRESLRQAARGQHCFVDDRTSSSPRTGSDVADAMDPAETFDPLLHSPASMSYEGNGALIDAIRIVSLAGRQVNQLLSRTIYRCTFRVQFVNDASNVRFAFLIRSAGLLDLGGAYSAPAPEDGIPFVCAGTVVEVDFEFECVLNPENYFLSVSAFASLGGVEFALHGISCAAIFRVVANKCNPSIAHVALYRQFNVRTLEVANAL